MKKNKSGGDREREEEREGESGGDRERGRGGDRQTQRETDRQRQRHIEREQMYSMWLWLPPPGLHTWGCGGKTKVCAVWSVSEPQITSAKASTAMLHVFFLLFGVP